MRILLASLMTLIWSAPPTLAHGWEDYPTGEVMAGTGERRPVVENYNKALTRHAPTPGQATPRLKRTVNGAPNSQSSSFAAGGNIALRQQKLRFLPPTRLDSFVDEAERKGVAEFIYGDEGGPDTGHLPPIEFFTGDIHDGSRLVKHANTIESGFGEGYKELTTHHRSPLPSAWLDTENE